MTAAGFGSSARLKRRAEFKRVYDEGRRVVTPYFVAFAAGSSHGSLRVGVVASRRVGGAVARNRAKRVLREVFRKKRAELNVSADLVLVARGNILPAPVREVEKAFDRFVPRVLASVASADRQAER